MSRSNKLCNKSQLISGDFVKQARSNFRTPNKGLRVDRVQTAFVRKKLGKS